MMSLGVGLLFLVGGCALTTPVTPPSPTERPAEASAKPDPEKEYNYREGLHHLGRKLAEHAGSSALLPDLTPFTNDESDKPDTFGRDLSRLVSEGMHQPFGPSQGMGRTDLTVTGWYRIHDDHVRAGLKADWIKDTNILDWSVRLRCDTLPNPETCANESQGIGVAGLPARKDARIAALVAARSALITGRSPVVERKGDLPDLLKSLSGALVDGERVKDKAVGDNRYRVELSGRKLPLAAPFSLIDAKLTNAIPCDGDPLEFDLHNKTRGNLYVAVYTWTMEADSIGQVYPHDGRANWTLAGQERLSFPLHDNTKLPYFFNIRDGETEGVEALLVVASDQPFKLKTTPNPIGEADTVQESQQLTDLPYATFMSDLASLRWADKKRRLTLSVLPYTVHDPQHHPKLCGKRR